jgi:hypothetical protein
MKKIKLIETILIILPAQPIFVGSPPPLIDVKASHNNEQNTTEFIVNIFQMIGREEAHWSSFRSAVVSFQQSLEEHSRAPTTENRGSSGRHAERSSDIADIRPEEKACPPARDGNCVSCREENSRFVSEGTPTSPKKSTKDTKKEHHKAKTIINDSWDRENTTSTNQVHHQHQQLELIGLEEVDKDVNKNKARCSEFLSPANELSQTSHTDHTSALSIAEQRLAEVKLKLSMTEAERDELEFQLMQT